jgi:hypothetical protein
VTAAQSIGDGWIGEGIAVKCQKIRLRMEQVDDPKEEFWG